MADTLEQVETGHTPFFSWRTLISGQAADPHELRRLILVDPRLDFNKLEPGSDASSDIRQVAKALNLDAAHGVRVRLTGPSPLEDEEFATLADRALQTHGGMGYSEEYHVARYFREARLTRIAPISQEMILNYLGSHVLGLPRSY